ncbi:MAG: hypothetical protein M1420_00010 [Actinobacteria bacterium]|jgi:hypothetical protein|nr:hypothetical protein [Actinomycetota bacterium]
MIPENPAPPDLNLASLFPVANAIVSTFTPKNAAYIGASGYMLAQCLRARGIQVYDAEQILDGHASHEGSYELLIAVPVTDAALRGPGNPGGRNGTSLTEGKSNWPSAGHGGGVQGISDGRDGRDDNDSGGAAIPDNRAGNQGNLATAMDLFLGTLGMPSTASLLCIPPASDRTTGLDQVSRRPDYKELKDVFISHGMYPATHNILSGRSEWGIFTYLNIDGIDAYIAHLEKRLEDTRALRHQAENELKFNTEAFSRAQRSRSWIIAQKLSRIRYHRPHLDA